MPNLKKIAFIEHSDKNVRKFDKCFLISYSLDKDKLFFHPYEDDIQGIIETFDIIESIRNKYIITNNSINKLFYYDQRLNTFEYYTPCFLKQLDKC